MLPPAAAGLSLSTAQYAPTVVAPAPVVSLPTCLLALPATAGSTCWAAYAELPAWVGTILIAEVGGVCCVSTPAAVAAHWRCVWAASILLCFWWEVVVWVACRPVWPAQPSEPTAPVAIPQPWTNTWSATTVCQSVLPAPMLMAYLARPAPLPATVVSTLPLPPAWPASPPTIISVTPVSLSVPLATTLIASTVSPVSPPAWPAPLPPSVCPALLDSICWVLPATRPVREEWSALLWAIIACVSTALPVAWPVCRSTVPTVPPAIPATIYNLGPVWSLAPVDSSPTLRLASARPASPPAPLAPTPLPANPVYLLTTSSSAVNVWAVPLPVWAVLPA